MDGTLKNYLLHVVAGAAIWLALGLVLYAIGYPRPHIGALLFCVGWYYAHETTDREHDLSGPARKNLKAPAFWLWSRDNWFDFLSGVAPAVVGTVVIELV